ncbi:hypothetical protein [Bacillus pretiosus]|uniref:hypothetical protein n=1 Tax=Bacillus pretiosus TaxID=2983392 RepID=UPI002ED95053
MGTSSIYNGPKDKNPLLPEGFEDDYNTNEADDNDLKEDVNKESEILGSWQETKRAMSQYITGNSKSKGRVLSNYVKAMGGSRASANQAISGRNATIQLGRILSSISSKGIIQTLKDLKIDYIGKDVQVLLSELVNIIAFDSSTKENIVAKNATIEAMSQMYEYIEENNMDINSLDSMNEEIFEELMGSFVSSYIFERMLNDLQSRFEKYAEGSQDALQKESEFKEYIKVSVELKLNEIQFNQINYNSPNINTIIEDLYRGCYEVLEAYL